MKKDQLSLYQGILFNNEKLLNGEKKLNISYFFDHPNYTRMYNEYYVDQLTKDLPTIYKTSIIMSHFLSKISFELLDDFDYEYNSFEILNLSYENEKKKLPFNKAIKLFHDLLMSARIKSRRIRLYPYSVYDQRSHEVIEVFDEELNKWVMFDFLNCAVLFDIDKKPLSLLEIRSKLAHKENIYLSSIGSNIKNPEKECKKSISYLTFLAQFLTIFSISDINSFVPNILNYFITPEHFDIKTYMEERYKMILGTFKETKNKDTNMYVSRIKKERESFRENKIKLISFRELE